MYVHVYTCKYTYIYTYMFKYIYIHKYIYISVSAKPCFDLFLFFFLVSSLKLSDAKVYEP
jgi:hypothetical protein